MTDREPTREEQDRIVEVEAEVRDNDRRMNQPCPNCGAHRADLQVFCGACGEKPMLDTPVPVLTDEERARLLACIEGHDGPACFRHDCPDSLPATVASILAARVEAAHRAGGVEALREAAKAGDQYLMDAWWTASGDGCAIPDWMPRLFLEELADRATARANQMEDGAR